MNVVINSTKVKLAWREKYVTEGANQQALAHPRGIYRGFWLTSRASPDTYLRLVPRAHDPDQFAVYANRDDGYAVSVRETAEVEINCAALFPVGGGGESWYVYLKVAYSANSDTDARYYVEKTDPHLTDPSAVILGVIPMAFGATVIDLDPEPGTLYDRRVRPEPTAVEEAADYVAGDEPWGLLDGVGRWCQPTVDEKKAMAAATAPSATNPFATQSETIEWVFGEPTLLTFTGLSGTVYLQLTGKYYVGKGAEGTAQQYFFLRSADFIDRPAIRDTNSRLFYVKQVRNATNTDELDPLADADAFGFYTNPYLVLHCYDLGAGYTGDLVVRAFAYARYADLSQAPAYALPVAGMESTGHSDLIRVPDHTGTPDSLSAGTLYEHIASLLSGVNARIKTVHPTASPSGWTLLWRSHNVTSDGAVTKTTNSIYFGSNGYLILQGGYVSGTNVVAGTGTGDVGGYLVHDSAGVTYTGPVMKDSPTAASTWDVLAGWDTYDFLFGKTNLMHAPTGGGSGGTSIVRGENVAISGDIGFDEINPGDAVDFNLPINVLAGQTATFNGTAVFQDDVDFNDPVDFTDTVNFAAGKTVTHNGPVTFNDVATFAAGKTHVANGPFDFNDGADFNDAVDFNVGFNLVGGTATFSTGTIVEFVTPLLMYDNIELGSGCCITEETPIASAHLQPLLVGESGWGPAIYWSQYGVWICSNCRWDNTEHKWYAILPTGSNRDAVALVIGGVAGGASMITLLSMSHDDLNYSTVPAGGWVDTEWTRRMDFGDPTLSPLMDRTYTYNGFNVSGNFYEQLPFYIGGKVQVITESGHTHDVVLKSGQGLAYVNRREVAPTLNIVPTEYNCHLAGTAVVSMSACPEWGCYVWVESVQLTPAQDYYSKGYVEAY